MKRVKKILALVMAVTVTAACSVCSFATVKTFDNGSQVLVCSGKSEKGTLLVVNQSFVITNTSKKDLKVNVIGNDIDPIKSGDSLVVSFPVDCALSYNYSSKKSSVKFDIVTEENAATATKNNAITKPSGTKVANIDVLNDLINYAQSLGCKVSNSGGMIIFNSPRGEVGVVASFTKDGSWAQLNDYVLHQMASSTNFTVDQYVSTFEMMAGM